MAKQDQFLTTREFASKIGISTSTVSKLIREHKISAEKKSGKWMISPDQLKTNAVKELRVSGNKSAGKKAVKSAPKKTASRKPASAPKKAPAKSKKTDGKSYTIAEFANLTYLTEFGVKEWLNKGRLTGQQAPDGEWKIEAANLKVPALKHLVRHN
jgi:excisionase family DNA binding protein